MVHIILSSYPLQSSQECAKVYLEVAPIPDYITEKGIYIRLAQDVGVEVIHILEFDNSKVSEAYEYIGKRIMAFSKVPGFSCSSQPWMSVEDALKTLE
jgi:hypothetical protein